MAALAAIALVPLTAAFARLLGGDRISWILAAAAAGLSPGLAALTTTTTTSTFEPIAWTASAYFLTLAIVRREGSALFWAAIVAGVAMETKYGIGIWLLGLGLGLALTEARAIFAQRSFWSAAALGAIVAAPSILWQAAHGWPFFEVIGHHESAKTIFTGTLVEFAIGQIRAMNYALAPLWLVGVVAPFASVRFAPARFLSIAFVGATCIVYIGGGKDYYLYPVYPTMFAVGASVCRDLRPGLAWAWFASAAVVALIFAPVALPLLEPPHLAAYLNATNLRPPPDEAAAVGAPLTQPPPFGTKPILPLGAWPGRRQRDHSRQRRSGAMAEALPQPRNRRHIRRALRHALRERPADFYMPWLSSRSVGSLAAVQTLPVTRRRALDRKSYDRTDQKPRVRVA